jgi:hypothetical protein
MADYSIQGSDIQIYVRDNSGGTVWKQIVCEETLTFDISSEVNTTRTKCGIFKGVLVPDFKASGTAVCNSQPTSLEFSHDELTTNVNNRTLKQFRIQDSATLGSVILLAGTGYFVSQQITFNNGEVCKFSWTLEGTGTLETHES